MNSPPRRMREPSEETENDSTEDKVKTEPNAIGKLWKEIKKEEMPEYDVLKNCIPTTI